MAFIKNQKIRFENKRIISFYARNPNSNKNIGRRSLTGHIWIGFEDEICFGFQIQGVVVEDCFPFDLKVCFGISVNKYLEALEVIKANRNKKYFLDGDTCIGLAVKAAKAAGLKVPSDTGWITMLPTGYLKDIKQNNSDKIVKCKNY